MTKTWTSHPGWGKIPIYSDVLSVALNKWCKKRFIWPTTVIVIIDNDKQRMTRYHQLLPTLFPKHPWPRPAAMSPKTTLKGAIISKKTHIAQQPSDSQHFSIAVAGFSGGYWIMVQSGNQGKPLKQLIWGIHSIISFLRRCANCHIVFVVAGVYRSLSLSGLAPCRLTETPSKTWLERQVSTGVFKTLNHPSTTKAMERIAFLHWYDQLARKAQSNCQAMALDFHRTSPNNSLEERSC